MVCDQTRCIVTGKSGDYISKNKSKIKIKYTKSTLVPQDCITSTKKNVTEHLVQHEYLAHRIKVKKLLN